MIPINPYVRREYDNDIYSKTFPAYGSIKNETIPQMPHIGEM